MKALSLIKPQFITDAKGQKKGVLLSMKDYKALIEELEDIEDAQIIEERQNEPTVPLEQVIRDLKKNGRL